MEACPDREDSGVEWLLEVPAHWEMRRLATISEIRVSNVDKHSKVDEEPVRLCNYVDVYKNERVRADIHFMRATASDREIEKFRLARGDILITKDSEDWKDIGVPALVEYAADDLVCGYHVAILRPNTAIVGDYLLRALQSREVAWQFQVAAAGVTRYGLTRNAIRSARIPLPQLRKQSAIARFLDHADRRIRRYIRAKEKLITLLKEQKQAIIHQAVTGRIDVRTGQPYPAYKDSGVEWLGEVPEHWEIRRIKSLSVVKRGASPRPIAEAKYFEDDGEYAWVRIADVTASDRYLEKTTQRLSPLGQSLSVELQPGSLFLSIAGSVGKPIVTRIKCCIHDGFVYFPEFKGDVEFLCRVFSCRTLFGRLGKFGTQLNLNTDTVGGICCGWPPQSEQRRIVQFLDNATGTVDHLISSSRRQIRFAQEYRTRLIGDVVTGKLDVREAAATLPDIDPLAAGDTLNDPAEPIAEREPALRQSDP